jgi:hypothetical protein
VCIILNPPPLRESLLFVQLVRLGGGRAVGGGETIIVVDGEEVHVSPRMRHDGEASSGSAVDLRY